MQTSIFVILILLDFKKEEVRLQVDDSGNITVSGERLVNNNKYVYFEQTFKMPENSDIDKISGKFEGEILYVTVPKQVLEEKKEPEIGIAEDKAQQNTLVDENFNENNEDHGNDELQNKEKKEMRKKRNSVDGFHREILKKWELEATPLERAMKVIRKNKVILITAVVAFSLGVLITRYRFESAGE